MKNLHILIEMLKIWGQSRKRHPKWYWGEILESSKILSVEKRPNNKNKYLLEDVLIKIDTNESSKVGVVSIRFMECQLTEGDIDIQGKYWATDFLVMNKGKYRLKIILLDDNHNESKIELLCKGAEVEYEEGYEPEYIEEPFDFMSELKGIIGVILRWRLDTKTYPEWYWRYGLHDAQILEVNMYNEEKKSNRAKYLELKLEAEQSYTPEISTIIFEDYRILSGDTNIKGSWWMSDKLKKVWGGYVLKIITQNENKQKQLSLWCKGIKVSK